MHFAIIAPPLTSHIRAMEAIAWHLLSEGHRISWIHQADVAQSLSLPEIDFHAVGSTSHPVGSLEALVQRAANPGGISGLKQVINDVASGTEMLCNEAPVLLEKLGVDVLLADQMEAAGGLIAQALGLPFVSIACALPVNREPRVPLPVMPWGYAVNKRGEKLNEGSTMVYDWLMQPHEAVIRKQASRFGLADMRTLADCVSSLAQVSQTTRSFDFPRHSDPIFHHVGPLRLPISTEQQFTQELDSARPFVFASLGTLQGWRFPLFKRIARACRAEGTQVLIAHCNRLDRQAELQLIAQGATAVTGFVPQRAALRRAQIVVTHAGLNTVMDALEAGTPQLALPIAFDQPGVAARVTNAGTGLKIFPPFATERAMRRAIRRLLEEPSFRERSVELGRDIPSSGGASRAAQIALAVGAGRRSGVALSSAPGGKASNV